MGGYFFLILAFSLFITVSVISYALKPSDESQDFSWSLTSFLLVLSISDNRKLFFFFSCWQGETKKTLAGLWQAVWRDTSSFYVPSGSRVPANAAMFIPLCLLSFSWAVPEQAGREGAQLAGLLAGGTSYLSWQSPVRPIPREILMVPWVT